MPFYLLSQYSAVSARSVARLEYSVVTNSARRAFLLSVLEKGDGSRT